jgi:hypothetical protein
MITPQFTYDNKGKRIGVFLPIEDWDLLKKIPAVEELSKEEFLVPDWQIELGKKELQSLANGNTELID